MLPHPMRHGENVIRICAILAMAAILVTAACKVGPNYEKPQVLQADLWTPPVEGPISAAEPNLLEWWKRFQDPVLDQLIVQAQESNATIEKSLANVRVSLAVLGVSESQFWPTIQTAIEYSRNKTNISLLAAQGVQTSPYDLWVGGAAMASWEIDVWGRVARLVEGAKATLESSVEDLRGVLISIRSQVGTTYMNVRTLQLQLSILQSSVKNYKTTLDLVKDKFKAGTNTLLDVNQAQTDLDIVAATIPKIEGDLDAAIFSLAQLCGTTSGPMTMLLGEPAPLPQMNEEIGIGIPAELLRRRPDVRSSERLVAAAVANIGAQEALNLPIFSLSGNFYLASNQFTGLGDSNNASYGFGPSISWLIFQGGYVNSMIAQSKGQAQVALAGYRDTVLGAMRDVETSISLLVHAKRSAALYATAEKSAQETYNLANLQYKAGRTNLDTLIRVQNELLNTQKQLADSQGSVAQNTVSLYRALGGGWEDGAVNRAAERSAAMKDPS